MARKQTMNWSKWSKKDYLINHFLVNITKKTVIQYTRKRNLPGISDAKVICCFFFKLNERSALGWEGGKKFIQVRSQTCIW